MATAYDLLIPLQKEDGMYDTELLKTFLKSFYNYCVSDVARFVSVARMLEKFLYVVAASDACLKVERFKELAEIVVSTSCEVPRYSDGIYKAIDVYLEMHKGLIESENLEACRCLDCKKLSPEACEHASKNEKLPLRVVMQVLYVSQMQIRNQLALKDLEEKTEEVDEEEDDEMSKNLLKLDIESDYRKKRKIENRECVVHCAKKNKVSVWKEVKSKFGCLSSSTQDTCSCHRKKRKKTSHYYK